MFTLWRCFIDWLSSFFWKEEMEITLVGLNNSGKTSFLNVISNGSYAEDMAPTIGFNFRKMTKGGVTIKMWDIGGQARYRHMWLRYCRSVDVIVFMVDSADEEQLLKAKIELETLVSDRYLMGIPIIVLGNKNDLRGALDEREIIEIMDLCSIQDRELCCFSISCKDQENINLALQWIVQHRKGKK